MSEDIEKVEESKEEVKKPVPKKTVAKKKAKEPEVTITVDQFCRTHGVLQLDVWVAKKFWSKDRKTVKQWEAAFDDKKIPYKR